jgi:hypothetical protein
MASLTTAAVASGLKALAERVLQMIDEYKALLVDVDNMRITVISAREFGAIFSNRTFDLSDKDDARLHQTLQFLEADVNTLRQKLQELTQERTGKFGKLKQMFTGKSIDTVLQPYLRAVKDRVNELDKQQDHTKKESRFDAGNLLKKEAKEFWNTNFGSEHLDVEWRGKFLLAMEKYFSQPLCHLEEELRLFFRLQHGVSSVSVEQFRRFLVCFGPFGSCYLTVERILALRCFYGVMSREGSETELSSKVASKLESGKSIEEVYGMYLLRFSDHELDTLVLCRVDPSETGKKYSIAHRKIKFWTPTGKFYTKMSSITKVPEVSYSSVLELLVNDKKLKEGCKVHSKAVQDHLDRLENTKEGVADSSYGEGGYY